MEERNVLLEMLILESKGFLNIPPKRIIELCCGWEEGSCNDEMEYAKYIECYDLFFILNKEYVGDNVHVFGPSMVFESINGHVKNGCDFEQAVIKMIVDKFYCSHITLAEPPYEYLSDEMKENIKVNSRYMDMYMFDGKIEHGIISLEIV